MFDAISTRTQSDNESTTLDIAPLIDVVFILLIFFLVTTSFLKDTGIEVQKPTSQKAQSLQNDSMRIYITANGTIYIHGSLVNLAGCSKEVKAFVEGKGTDVVIVPDESVTAGRLVEVMDAVKSGGSVNIAIASREAE